MNRFDIGRCHCLQSRITFVAIWIPVGLSSGLSPRCDTLTLVPLCDHKRDWHLKGLWLTFVSPSSLLQGKNAECVNQ